LTEASRAMAQAPCALTEAACGAGFDESIAAAWLSPGERDLLATFADPGRRAGFLAARVLAKQLVLKHERRPSRDASAVEIVSRDAAGRGTRPTVSVDGRVRPWCLSISHTAAAALVALCTTEGVSIGVDLVKIELLGSGFAQAWFDDEEQQFVAESNGNGEIEACRLWAVKEAVYKATAPSKPFRPRQIHVCKCEAGAYTCIGDENDFADRLRIDTWPCADHVAALAVVTPTFQSPIPNP